MSALLRDATGANPASPEQQISGPLFVPAEILPAGSIERPGAETVFDGIHGSAAFPLMYLGMSIRKRESTRTVMEGSRQIAPLARVNIDDEKAIINRIRMLVNCEPRKCG